MLKAFDLHFSLHLMLKTFGLHFSLHSRRNLYIPPASRASTVIQISPRFKSGNLKDPNPFFFHIGRIASASH